MIPSEVAASLYGPDGIPGSFRDDLNAHLHHGFVVSTPDAFAMGRPVARVAPHRLHADPWFEFPPESCDAWMIWLAAGEVGDLWRLFPYELPWVGWARRQGNLRWYEFNRFQSSLAKINKT